MADPVIQYVKDPNDPTKVIPVKADAEGRPLVSADLGVDIGTGVPLGSETWMPVAIVQQANPLQVETVNNPTAAATPGAGDEGIVVRSPMEPDITAIRGNTNNTVIELQAIQAQLAAVGTEVTLQQVRDAVIALGAGFTLADLYGALTPLATEATLATRASEATALQIEDEVDDLEPDVDASRVAVESIDAKTLPALGTAFAAPVRATATNAAAQLPDASYPRGFVVKNRDASANLYVGSTSGVTTASGLEITPGESVEFDLPNSNVLWVISATTTAYQIGATT